MYREAVEELTEARDENDLPITFGHNLKKESLIPMGLGETLEPSSSDAFEGIESRRFTEYFTTDLAVNDEDKSKKVRMPQRVTFPDDQVTVYLRRFSPIPRWIKMRWLMHGANLAL
jgi:hypothetical protein